MGNKFVLTLGIFSVFNLSLSGNVLAQEFELQNLRKQIQIFTGVLQEGLELDASPGFLGINSGRVTSVYLQNQGVLFEIRSPLANQRNRVSLNALASSIRGISGGANPFEAMRRSRSDPQAAESRVLSQTSELAVEAAQRAAESIRAIDYQSAIDAALREAYRGVRMLQDIGDLEEQDVTDLRGELDLLGKQLQESLQQLRQLEGGLDEQTAQTGASTSQSREQQLEQLRTALEGLGGQARQKAAELNAQYEQAREGYRLRWQQEVVAFEDSLFSLLCDYGATLRDLPDDEHVSVLLIGLGADTEQALSADRLHVVVKSDLIACQSGELNWQALRQQAASYNY